MGVLITSESEWGKELAKWEQFPNKPYIGEAGPGNPYVYREYPRMLYRAQRMPNGKVSCGEAPPHPHYFADPQAYDRELGMIESFNRSCYRLAKDESEEAVLKGQGWCRSQQEALAAFEREQQAIGNAAAEAAYAVARMSDKAQAEHAAAEASTEHHVVDVVPARKRGRPVKGIVAQTE